MVEEGLKVTFTSHRCFVEDMQNDCYLVAKGNRNGRMFLLEIIHSDVWTTKTRSIGGCNYYVSFIDDHTRKVWVYFMK